MAEKSYGSIFYNNRKKNPREPDARGVFNITPELIEQLRNAPVNNYGQVEVAVALWKKTGPKAGEYLNGNLEISNRPSRGGSSGGSSAPSEPDMDEEVPF